MFSLLQGSAAYGFRAGSGPPSNFILPAHLNAHPARDLFFVMIEIHQQPRQNVPHFLVETFFLFLFLLVSTIESAVKCLIFRQKGFFLVNAIKSAVKYLMFTWRPFFFGPLEWDGPLEPCWIWMLPTERKSCLPLVYRIYRVRLSHAPLLIYSAINLFLIN